MSFDIRIAFARCFFLVYCTSFSKGLLPLNIPTRRNICSTTGLHDTCAGGPSTDTGPDRPELRKIESESNFWFSVVTQDSGNDDSADRIPCVPSLDADGPLPPGAYRILGAPENDPARTCLVTVAVDLTKQGFSMSNADSNSLEPETVVKDMHLFIDSGLTTFQMISSDGHKTETQAELLQEWGEENVYGRLRRETPTSVLRDCHFVVPMKTPSKDSSSSSSSVRETVLNSLHRIGADCIDTLQLQYCHGSPYHIDVLDVLCDLQREGLVRSISGLNMPAGLIRSAEGNGFHLDSNQFDCNLLDPTGYTRTLRKTCSELGGKLLLSSPLAGGLLTERHLNEIREPPLPWELTLSEQRHTKSTLKRWTEIQPGGGDTEWQRYQRLVMGTLEEVAFKHEANVASVSMRWAMQLEHVGSVVAACSLGYAERPCNRHGSLRDIFRFELDTEDMERLWKISGGEEVTEELDFSSFNVEDMENIDPDSLFLPEENDKSLWV